jgi:hypothetical protein
MSISNGARDRHELHAGPASTVIRASQPSGREQ